jgi:hypothetical protein
MQYRIKYSLWRVEASSREEAKNKIVSILKASAENWVTVEEDTNKHSVFYRILTGK